MLGRGGNPRVEETNVNRPFSALGTLAAMLALAMFAVSSTSRSTTVRPSAKRRPALAHIDLHVSIRTPKAKPPAPTAPVASEVARSPGGNCPAAPTCGNWWPSLQAAAAKRRAAAAEVTGASQTVPSALRPVCVIVAEFSAPLPPAPEPMDCRSHYDPQYDLVVYGPTAGQESQPRPLPQSPPAIGDSSESADIVTIFGELLTAKPAAPSARGPG
jgi:hypothetical protein